MERPQADSKSFFDFCSEAISVVSRDCIKNDVISVRNLRPPAPDLSSSSVEFSLISTGTRNPGHIKETVTNSKTKTSVVVPEHPILRSIAGVVAKVEYRRFSLSLDGAMMHLATNERIAFETTSGVGTREIHGLQPHSKASFNVFLDPGKHYAFSVVYENGRMPPNFEYLNKVATGITLLY